MNWHAYFLAAIEELDIFLADSRNAEWHDTMRARVAEEILAGIAECSSYVAPRGMLYQADIMVALIKKCKAKAESMETKHAG